MKFLKILGLSFVLSILATTAFAQSEFPTLSYSIEWKCNDKIIESNNIYISVSETDWWIYNEDIMALRVVDKQSCQIFEFRIDSTDYNMEYNLVDYLVTPKFPNTSEEFTLNCRYPRNLETILNFIGEIASEEKFNVNVYGLSDVDQLCRVFYGYFSQKILGSPVDDSAFVVTLN